MAHISDGRRIALRKKKEPVPEIADPNQAVALAQEIRAFYDQKGYTEENALALREEVRKAAGKKGMVKIYELVGDSAAPQDAPRESDK